LGQASKLAAATMNNPQLPTCRLLCMLKSGQVTRDVSQVDVAWKA
jgi:hypothetical protein